MEELDSPMLHELMGVSEEIGDQYVAMLEHLAHACAAMPEEASIESIEKLLDLCIADGLEMMQIKLFIISKAAGNLELRRAAK